MSIHIFIYVTYAANGIEIGSSPTHRSGFDYRAVGSDGTGNTTGPKKANMNYYHQYFETPYLK